MGMMGCDLSLGFIDVFRGKTRIPVGPRSMGQGHHFPSQTHVMRAMVDSYVMIVAGLMGFILMHWGLIS